MNYITTRKLIVSNILVSGLLIFSGLMFGMQKELKISDSIIVPQKNLIAWADHGYQSIESDGTINKNSRIKLWVNGNMIIKEKKCQSEKQTRIGDTYLAFIVRPGVIDENCYLKVSQKYIMETDECGKVVPDSGSFRDIENFFVRIYFVKKQLKAVARNLKFGKPDGSVYAFDLDCNLYGIYGFFSNDISKEVSDISKEVSTDIVPQYFDFFCIGFCCGVIVSAFFLYVNGLGVK